VRRLHGTPAAALVAALVSACVAACVALAGCAGQPGEAGASDSTTAVASESTASTAPPTTAAPPKPLSRAQAARRYLAIVKPYNVALERLEQSFNAGKPIAELRVLADRVAKANTAEMRELRATVWPANVRAPIRELVAESEAAQRYWRQAAKAGTRDELLRAVQAAGRHDGSEPAGKIRKTLDLDAYSEGDYSAGNP
jgi:hypothetical protein